MLRVGLTGGIGSGKSFVGQEFARLGCLLIQADEVAREMQQPGGEAFDGIVREFGPGILDSEGRIDRKRLAADVFHNPGNLAKLNALVHPYVRQRVHQMERGFAREHPSGIAVTEAAILVETGSYRDYDCLVVAICRPEQQIERVMARDHITREEALDRIHRQMPLEEKVKYADYTIDTSGRKEDTIAQTVAVYEALRSMSR